MSEFCCANGHLILSRDKGKCPQCGLGIHTMDGMTNRQCRLMDEYEEKHKYDYADDEPMEEGEQYYEKY